MNKHILYILWEVPHLLMSKTELKRIEAKKKAYKTLVTVLLYIYTHTHIYIHFKNLTSVQWSQIRFYKEARLMED